MSWEVSQFQMCVAEGIVAQVGSQRRMRPLPHLRCLHLHSLHVPEHVPDHPVSPVPVSLLCHARCSTRKVTLH